MSVGASGWAWHSSDHCSETSVLRERVCAVLSHQLPWEHSDFFTASSLRPSSRCLGGSLSWNSSSYSCIHRESRMRQLVNSLSLHSESLISSESSMTTLPPTAVFHCQDIDWCLKIASMVKKYILVFLLRDFFRDFFFYIIPIVSLNRRFQKTFSEWSSIC